MADAMEPAHISLDHEYKGITIPNIMLDSSIDALQTFEVRPDDVWIVTYPKAGTHWMMEIVGLIMARGIPEKIDRYLSLNTIEMIERTEKLPENREEELKNPPVMKPFMDRIEKAPSPRVILTHLPLQFLPPTLIQTGKVIYVSRNPKDTINSLYNMMGNGPYLKVKWDMLIQAFMANKCPCGPWVDHNIKFWDVKDEGNVLFLFYDRMKKDPLKYVRQVAEHINVQLSDEELQKVVEHSSFAGMGKTYSNAGKIATQEFATVITSFSFMNKGVSGQWKNRFTVAQNEAFDKWFQENTAHSDFGSQFE